MRNNLEIALRISSDLMTYCHNHGARDYETKISEGEESIKYVITASPVTITEEQLEGLEKKLHAPRQRDVEREYWELIGESDSFSELTLVGMSCDEADINYNGREITFTLLRHY